MTARLIREFGGMPTRVGEVLVAKAYELDPPHGDSRYVKVSAANVLGEIETLIFPCDANGEVTDWCEIGGRRGIDSPDDLLAEMGYEVAA